MKTKSFRLLPFLIAIVMVFLAIGPSALAASELRTISEPFSDEQKEENTIGSLISDSYDRLDKPNEHDHEHTRGSSADEQTIWNYLYSKLGNAYGAASVREGQQLGFVRDGPPLGRQAHVHLVCGG